MSAAAAKKSPTFYRRSVIGGETWSDGAYMLSFLRARCGLEPSHTILDIGCGPIRFGLHAIPFLATGSPPGRYIGVDNNATLIEQAGLEAEKAQLSPSGFELYRADNFVGPVGPGTVDIAWAYSLWTHLHPNQIVTCMQNALRVLKPGCSLYASANLGPKEIGKPHDWRDELTVCWYPLAFLKRCGARAGEGIYIERVSGPLMPNYRRQATCDMRKQNIVRVWRPA